MNSSYFDCYLYEYWTFSCALSVMIDLASEISLKDFAVAGYVRSQSFCFPAKGVINFGRFNDFLHKDSTFFCRLSVVTGQRPVKTR